MERNTVVEALNDPHRLRIMGIQFGIDGMDITYSDENMNGKIVRSFITSGIDFHADLGPEVSESIIDIVDSTRGLIEQAHKREVGVPDTIYSGIVKDQDGTG